MKGSTILAIVIVAVIVGAGALMMQAQAAGPSDSDPVPYGVKTFYDQSASVFCATRQKAVSCVYVPRDTVKQHNKWGNHLGD